MKLLSLAEDKFRSSKGQFLLSTVGVFLLLYIRKGDVFVYPQLWAEDGLIFFQQAYENGADALITPYAGYHHFLIRVIAFMGSFAPYEFIPWVYQIGCFAVHLLVLTLIFSPRFDAPYKPLFALATIGAPVDTEVFLNITNTQWLLAMGLIVLLCFKNPASKLEKFTDLTLLTLLGLTGPYCVILFPLMFLRWFRERTSHSLHLLATWTFLVFVQALNLTEAIAQSSKAHELFDYVRVLSRGFWLIFFGAEGLPAYHLYFHHSVIAISAILLYGYFSAAAFKKGDNTLLMLTLSGVLIFLSVIFKFKDDPKLLLFLAGRYYYIPTVAFSWAILKAAKEQKALWVLITLMSANMLFSDSRAVATPYKHYNWAEDSKCIDCRESCTIPINPPNWTINLNSRSTSRCN